jgi:integrase
MNKTTRPLEPDEYKKIVETCRNGFVHNNKKVRPNPRIATVCVTQFCLGLRIGDILNLKLDDIIRDGSRYRLNIVEQKTKKKREYTVSTEVYTYLQTYCLQNGISPKERMFDLTVRSVQRHLQLIVEYLGIEGNISTHSIRKAFATQTYINNGKDLMLVRELLQHSSWQTTQRYIKHSSALIEQALESNVDLVD